MLVNSATSSIYVTASSSQFRSSVRLQSNWVADSGQIHSAEVLFRSGDIRGQVQRRIAVVRGALGEKHASDVSVPRLGRSRWWGHRTRRLIDLPTSLSFLSRLSFVLFRYAVHAASNFTYYFPGFRLSQTSLG